MSRLRKGLWAASGLFWFIWIGYEDQGLIPVLLLAALLSLTIGMEWYHRKHAHGSRLQRMGWIASASLGAVLGGAVPLLAVVLAGLKVSLHQHPIPDFSAAGLLQLLKLVPAWLVAGALMGAAAGLLVDLKSEDQP